MTVTSTGDASKAAATTTSTSASAFSGLVLQLAESYIVPHVFHSGDMPRIFSSMKVVPRRILTASFSTMCNVAF